VRVIGKEKMLRLFFGPAPLPAFWGRMLALLGLPIFPWKSSTLLWPTC